MTTDGPLAVRADDLRLLLDSTLDNPLLVLHEGRVEVVAGEDRRGLEVVSREDFVRTAGKAEFSDQELERQAVALSATVGNLGA